MASNIHIAPYFNVTYMCAATYICSHCGWLCESQRKGLYITLWGQLYQESLHMLSLSLRIEEKGSDGTRAGVQVSASTTLPTSHVRGSHVSSDLTKLMVEASLKPRFIIIIFSFT